MNNLALYLSNGAVDIGTTIGVVMLLVQMTKPIFDSLLDPAKPVHDTVVEVYALVLSLIAVYLLWWAGPGFKAHSDYAAWLINTVISVAAEFGIYGKIRGPVPATPTLTWFDHTRPVSPPTLRHGRHRKPAPRVEHDQTPPPGYTAGVQPPAPLPPAAAPDTGSTPVS